MNFAETEHAINESGDILAMRGLYRDIGVLMKRANIKISKLSELNKELSLRGASASDVIIFNEMPNKIRPAEAVQLGEIDIDDYMDLLNTHPCEMTVNEQKGMTRCAEILLSYLKEKYQTEDAPDSHPEER